MSYASLPHKNGPMQDTPMVAKGQFGCAVLPETSYQGFDS